MKEKKCIIYVGSDGGGDGSHRIPRIQEFVGKLAGYNSEIIPTISEILDHEGNLEITFNTEPYASWLQDCRQSWEDCNEVQENVEFHW